MCVVMTPAVRVHLISPRVSPQVTSAYADLNLKHVFFVQVRACVCVWNVLAECSSGMF